MQQPLDLEDNLGILGQMSGLSRTDESLQQHDGANFVAGQGTQPAEAAIMNMWTRMKTLEGKYIDLANFYKQELV